MNNYALISKGANITDINQEMSPEAKEAGTRE